MHHDGDITGMRAYATSKCKGGASSPLLPLQLASGIAMNVHVRGALCKFQTI